MKNKILRLAALAMVTLGAGAVLNPASAQVYVNVRPAWRPVPRPAPPGQGYVWIDEDWAPRGRAYVSTGGHWSLPPHRGWMWVPGRWVHNRRGDY